MNMSYYLQVNNHTIHVQVEEECVSLNIPFRLLLGHADKVLLPEVDRLQIKTLVTDFSPLRVPQQWVTNILKGLPKDDVNFYQVIIVKCATNLT